MEELGLLYAPHTSAGRLPTDLGLRLFVNGLLECGNLTTEEQQLLSSVLTELRIGYARVSARASSASGEEG